MLNFKNKKIIMVFLLFCVTLLFIGSVSAANQKITNTTSQSEIQGIISGTHSSIILNPGETLTFASGTYNWGANKGVIVTRGINIVGEGTVKIIGNGNTTTNNTINTAFNVTANNVKFSKLSISGFYYAIHSSSGGTSISDCEIFNNRRGVNTAGASNFILQNSNVYNNEREAVNLNGEKLTVKNNILRNNGFEAVHGHGLDSLVTNNTIVGNARPGMAAVDFHAHTGTIMKGLVFTDNIVRYNKGIGMILMAHSGTNVFNNRFYNNAETGIIVTNDSRNSKIYDNNIYKNLNGIENYGVKTTLTNNKIYSNTKNEIVDKTKDLIRNGNLINGNNESKSKNIKSNIKNIAYQYSVSKFTVQKGKSTVLTTEIKNSGKSISKNIKVRLTLPNGVKLVSINKEKSFNNDKKTWTVQVPAKKSLNLKVKVKADSTGNKRIVLNVAGKKEFVSLRVV